MRSHSDYRLGFSTFSREIYDIEQMLPKARDEDLTIIHWFFSSQYSDMEIESAEGLMDLVDGAEYRFIDFDMPDEDESQRYTHVEQTFVRYGNDVDPQTPSSMQIMTYLKNNYFAQSDGSKGL